MLAANMFPLVHRCLADSSLVSLTLRLEAGGPNWLLAPLLLSGAANLAFLSSSKASQLQKEFPATAKGGHDKSLSLLLFCRGGQAVPNIQLMWRSCSLAFSTIGLTWVAHILQAVFLKIKTNVKLHAESQGHKAVHPPINTKEDKR